MKKRVLSFLLACFMVVSTFIISRPIVDVHAVEVENGTVYELPLDWSTGTETDAKGWYMPYMGPWKLLGYTNLDTATPKLTTSALTPEEYKAQALKSNGHGKLPGPYLANNANETAVQTTNQTTYDNDGWYANWNQRWSGKIFDGDLTGMYAIAHANKPGAITFTAPADGIYSYTETVEQLLFLANSVNLEFEVTVRKNGEVLSEFLASESNKSATLSGEAYLMEGDRLMFAFEQTTEVTFSNKQEHKSNDPNCFKITNLVVTKTADIPEGYKGDAELPIIFDGTSFTDKFGMVELMGYDDATGAPYKDGIAIDTYGDSWYIYEPDGKSTYYQALGTGNKAKDNYLWAGSLSTGKITNVGGDFKLAGIGSTFVFTAPYAGTFKLDSTMTSAWPASQNGAWSEYLIQDEDGNVLSSATNTDKGNHYGSNTNATTVSATVTLAKGEKVYIIRRPLAGTPNQNVSCGGGATIKITALDHACSSETVKHITAVAAGCEDGNAEYWACPCGTNYADADATSEFVGDVVIPGSGHADSAEWGQSATQHWMFCGNGCGEYRVEKTNHTWENGVCTVCTYECQHENANVANCVSASVCPVCTVELAPINSNNHVMTNAVHANGNGTHRFVRVCCDASSIVTEDCAYDEDGICVVCGFDGSTLIEIENNINNAYDNLFNNGNGNVTAQGPATGALTDYITKTEGEAVEGVEYVLFNIHHENDKVTLRHHFAITGELPTITLNGETVTLIQSQGSAIWYFDVVPTLGKYNVADEISINGSVTYTVSLYSYIKKALASDEVSENAKAYLKALYDANEEANKVDPVLVAIANQAKKQIQVYDITDGDIDEPVWTYDNTVGTSSGFKVRKYNGRTVVLITTGTEAEMVDYETKERIWYTNNTPGNSHSIELLPNGVIAVAGTTGHDIHFYNINYSDPTHIHDEEALQSAHGVLWDPTEGVLWAAGRTHLWAYNITVDADGEVTATKDEVRSIELPDDHAHDLQPYYGNTDCLLISTHHYIYIYNKKTQSFAVLVTRNDVKGVTVLENGDIVYLYPNPDWSTAYDSWNTSWINKLDVATGETTEYHNTEGGRFYKLRAWNTNYQ